MYVKYSHSQTHKIFFYFHEKRLYQYSTAHDKGIIYGVGAVIISDISSWSSPLPEADLELLHSQNWSNSETLFLP